MKEWIIAVIIITSAFSISYYAKNSANASPPFPFFDPFTPSSQLTNSNISNEICGDSLDNDKNGLIDENCGFKSIAKVIEGVVNREVTSNNPMPEQEICNDGKDNNGNGLVDENCKPISNDNQHSNTYSPKPEREICGDLQDNDGNGLVDENCEPIGNINDNNQNAVPEQEICGDLQDNDGNGLVDENCVNNFTPNPEGSPPPISDNNADTNPPVGDKKDKFGIKMLYPTKSGGEQWYMRPDHPEKDPQFRPQVSLSKNSDGSFKVTDGKIRMGVWPSTGNHPEKITTYDEKELEKKGYMESPNDWRNVEITGYVKFNKGVNYDNFAWYARGGIHTDGKACEGTAYKGQLYYNGKTRFAKEQWFVSYVFSPYKQSMGSMDGKWIGFKTAMYNIEKNGQLVVKLEIWLDKANDGNWQKVYDYIDDGGWGNDGGECGGRPDQIISWGGPLAVFRWDNAFDVDIKDFSVREIQPNM
jgi:hypothetical protein